MQKYDLSQFSLNKEHGVYFSPVLTEFNYSDGDEQENKIYNQIQSSSNLSLFSNELVSSINDWPSEYHFSPLRHNLLRHLKFCDKDKILELGCGCGSITRQLGESKAEVVAIEGSPFRAKCAAARCRDLDNVKVYCSNFQNLSLFHEFDYVLLIGVLEYSSTFFDGEDPFKQCLEIAKSSLNANGKLIIAIENRLGLKYFMGLGEDHTGQQYMGIQDLYPPMAPKTFGKEELQSILKRSGFGHIEFQYPFPDYKIPNAIFTELAFKTEGFVPSDIICKFKSRDYSASNTPTFSEDLVWPQLASNGLVQALSNSFLVFAGIEPFINNGNKDSLLAIVYCTDRKVEYNTETDFLVDQNNEILVDKKLLFNEYPLRSNIVKLVVGENKYYQGSLLGKELINKLYNNDLQGFISLCNLWVNHIKKYGLIDKDDISCKALIRPEYIDCIPGNLILDQRLDKLEYFDREWHYMKPYTLELLIIRGLYQFQTMNGLDDFLIDTDSSFAKMVKDWIKSLGIILDKSLANTFVETEIILYDEIYGKGIWTSPIINLLNKIKESWVDKQIGQIDRFIKRVRKRYVIFLQIIIHS